MRALPFVSLSCLLAWTCPSVGQVPGDGAGRLLEAPPRAASPREAVVGFYRALANGDGIGAEWYVVPGKRGRGAFVASEMERFYGGLSDPLRLVAIDPDGPETFRVRYTFGTAGGGVCNGRARVQVRRTEAGWKVASIVAPSGC
jgi:hypothetical protein